MQAQTGGDVPPAADLRGCHQPDEAYMSIEAGIYFMKNLRIRPPGPNKARTYTREIESHLQIPPPIKRRRPEVVGSISPLQPAST